jgi:DNA-binding response OmpR family regulator
MLTARGFGLDDDQIRQTNIVDVLSKPFSPREVLSRVEKLLDIDSGVMTTP